MVKTRDTPFMCVCFSKIPNYASVHPFLGWCGFLGLEKVRMTQIGSTWFISNQKRMSEEFPSLK